MCVCVCVCYSYAPIYRNISRNFCKKKGIKGNIKIIFERQILVTNAKVSNCCRLHLDEYRAKHLGYGQQNDIGCKTVIRPEYKKGKRCARMLKNGSIFWRSVHGQRYRMLADRFSRQLDLAGSQQVSTHLGKTDAKICYIFLLVSFLTS